MDSKESKSSMSEEERLELCKKLDKELDEYIDGLEKKSYTEGWPEDRWEEEMEKHPFFMTQAPSSDDVNSPLVEGLQKLKYDAAENTPEELAANYKEDGNFNFKYKNYRLAILSYTEGLKAKCNDKELQAQLLNNRSASQFMLGNYRSSLSDAKACLKLDESHPKARMRAAQCCWKMGMFDDCLVHCDEFLSRNPTDAKALKIRADAVLGKKRAERDLRLEARKFKSKTSEKEGLMKAIKERGIKLHQNEDEEPNLEPLHPAAEGAKVTLGTDGRLSWPCLFMYPEHTVTEFVRQWHEDVTFHSQLGEMFAERAEWDQEGKYKIENLACYFEGDQSSREIHEIKLSSTLGKVLSDKRCTVVDGMPKFIVLVKDSRSEKNFIQQYNVSK
ncbi:DNA polymerase interacting tetratricopeptide repeat-containing, protein of 47 kDa [Ischnura elegans]|uniref:DNA polymerase interacting tetratricopeptide repeat-containing, protein of 47 kDa n=1 Tax=Ischnura elegans TaxID=197161 RepID=UPI001ED88FC2|nr:DNA polymerase interacting tetratricopeptide repeat-containing, protein of 47 kDa [Ischnura elegans]